ncbi:MAG: hypothetical protein NZM25_07385 [Leptospiraceae bacterium]|nr:hypothetical protein [Leptospiraceae bacterium]MDW8306485.1 hypothetical protein [Leptospiraceae bacterium]
MKLVGILWALGKGEEGLGGITSSQQSVVGVRKDNPLETTAITGRLISVAGAGWLLAAVYYLLKIWVIYLQGERRALLELWQDNGNAPGNYNNVYLLCWF